MQEMSFSQFLKEKRRLKEITVRDMASMADVSAGYYCDIESGRRNPPDRKIIDKMLTALNVSEEDRIIFYDLAGKARSEAPPDLPEYINQHEEVRTALRLARNGGDTTRVWNRFIAFLEEDDDVDYDGWMKKI